MKPDGNIKDIEKSHVSVSDELVKKLLLLFIFEKMEFPLTDASISEIIMANPSWMTYMDYKDALYLLTESKYIYRTSHGGDNLFNITQDGRMALAHFYTKIPASIREEITAFARDNRTRFKRSQEYTYDYFKNNDGTHTVVLRIKEGGPENLLEIRIKAPTRTSAIKAAARWKDKAAAVYETIHNTMLEEEGNT